MTAGRLSATVFKLELELKSLQSSQDAKPMQQMQNIHSSSDENTAAQMAALIRKAAAAQEAADSAQQQLSQVAQAHAEQMAGAQVAVESTQQELNHTSQSLTQLQEELVTARQSHADQVAVLQQQLADQVAQLQQQHAEQLAAVKAGFSETLAVSNTELSEAKSSLACTREQHAKSLAELQKQCDSQVTDAERKHAVMLAASHAELAATAARQHNIQQWLSLDQGYKNKLAQPQSLHSSLPLPAHPHHCAAVAQAYSQLLSAVAKHPSDAAPFLHLPASSGLEAELMVLKQHSNQAAAAATADTQARVVITGDSECTALRQSLTALEKQLSLAQAEVSSTSVGRSELVCRLKAAEQGSKHCWTAKDHVQQTQQLMQSVAGAVHKQNQAYHTVAVSGDSQSTQQHAVTSASRAKEEHGSANGYPSDEDDLDDWTQEDGDDASDAASVQQIDSTGASVGDSQSTWTISAGVTDCSSSDCSSSFPKPELQKMPDGASSRAEPAGSAAPQHARQGSFAELQISQSAQASSRSFAAASFAVSTTAAEPCVINSHPPECTFGSQVMPAANSDISSGSDDPGCAGRDCSCEVASAGVAEMDSSWVSDMHPSEENDLDDWTCDEDGACTKGGCCCALTSGSVAEARSSSALNNYPSDEDDLDDWTQEDADTLFE